MNSFNPSELLPLLGQLCAIKIVSKKDQYIGIGKLTAQERKLTVYFECAAHLKNSRRWAWWSILNGHASMRVCGMVTCYVAHCQANGVDLEPKDWQKITTDNGNLFLSFQEKEIEETDTFLDFHKT